MNRYYPCDDNTPDVTDEIIAEAAGAVLADLDELIINEAKLIDYCRESVRENTPEGWEDLLDVGDLADIVYDEVIDTVRWAQKNGHL